MKPSLSLRMSQHLALTPQLQQSIRLLQLSTLELSQEVDQMLDDNPFLERTEEEAPQEAFGLAQSDTHVSLGDRVSESASESAGNDDGASETRDEAVTGVAESWDGDGSVEMRPDDSEWGGEAGARQNNEEDTADAVELARSMGSLTDFLHRQALSLRLSEIDRAALRFLIESLNDDGYLTDTLPELAASLASSDDDEQLDELVHRFTVALGLLQSLEPVGVGARDLAECLRIQIKSRFADDPEDEAAQTALAVCAQPLELLAKRDFKRLAVLCSLSESRIKTAIAFISRLEPKPGRPFALAEQNIIVPDVLVTNTRKTGTPKFRIQLNPDVMPKLRVHDIYASALRGGKGDSHAGLQQRLQEARWFIKNIQQRFDTILRVSTAIVERQKNFLTHGELAMRPLVLREIADELGMHESTISRVTTAKYMATPQGTFELKYFFGSGLGTDSGSAASSTAVRALIKQFVAAESATKPLSDNQISEMLKEQGIDCARRTVAKYREALRIAPANLRKSMNG
ncbi:RNA polymerase factor sigma-54 [Limnohabitans sp. T6-5]|uniref:RNA polymerase factor sigma-54 n=1 Tax=Limnohabitans sp. T6-5 TaxID=1100724 RepID=UPI000D381CCB|nr:RNA polymerase factor sigma-54 [Limnohabitans sp. T6-5]PUE06386.1 RNA polymerase factor sigma-54 [Limnohabitans sp. T6-5]